jgi:putative PIN family toxin of toxin-antitoxin system
VIKVVLDTNSALSGLLDYAAPREIILLVYKRHVQLWGSVAAFSEFSRVVQYPRLERRILSKYLTISAIEHEYAKLLNLCNTRGIEPGILVKEDPDDDEFLRVAVAAAADFLVSRDKHLLDLVEFHTIPIVRPAQFMQLWRRNQQHKRKELSLWQRLNWRIWGKTRGT